MGAIDSRPVDRAYNWGTTLARRFLLASTFTKMRLHKLGQIDFSSDYQLRERINPAFP